jgi:hypothetical protein
VTLNVIYCIITFQVAYKGDILYVMYGRFVLSHLASQFLRLRAVDPLDVAALTFLLRFGARKGELAKTVTYYTDVVCFVYGSELEFSGGGRNYYCDAEHCVL